MTRRRRLTVLVVAIAAVLVAGTGAFSVASADRGAQLDVVDAEDALVAVEPIPVVADDLTHRHDLLVVHNRFAESVGVRIDVEDNTWSVPSIYDFEAHHFHLGPGEYRTVSAGVLCGVTETNDVWTFDVVVSSPGVTVELDRPVDVSCSGQQNATSNSTDG